MRLPNGYASMNTLERMQALVAAMDSGATQCPFCGAKLKVIRTSDKCTIVLCEFCMIALAK